MKIASAWASTAVKSRAFFEQMKGRGVRIMKADDLQSVTPDAKAKDHFVIIDAVGVCEQDKTDSRPMEQKPTVSFEKLMQAVAFGKTRTTCSPHSPVASPEWNTTSASLRQ